MQQSLHRLVAPILLAAAALSTPVNAAQPVAPAPIPPLIAAPLEPGEVRTGITDLKSACARWMTVPELRTGVVSPPLVVPGVDSTICSFVRDPEGASWGYMLKGAGLAVVLLIFGGAVLGAGYELLCFGRRALRRILSRRRIIREGG